VQFAPKDGGTSLGVVSMSTKCHNPDHRNCMAARTGRSKPSKLGAAWRGLARNARGNTRLSASATVMAITKCRIWATPVNQFTLRRDVLRQCGRTSLERTKR
jgi:hypothetical protein